MFNFSSGLPVSMTPDGKLVHLTGFSIKQNPILKEEKVKIKAETKKAFNTVLGIPDTFNRFDLKVPGAMMPVWKDAPEQREVFLVGGPSGSGKSVFVKNLVKSYHVQFPKNKVYLFSHLDEDAKDGFEELDVVRIAMDDSLIDDPLEAKIFKDCFLIFDDCDSLPEPYGKVIFNLINSCLQIGRHSNQSIAITTHMIRNYSKSRILLAECTALVVFPKAGNVYDATTALKTYCGLSKKAIEAVCKLPSRWVACYKTAPNFLTWEKGISTVEDIVAVPTK